MAMNGWPGSSVCLTRVEEDKSWRCAGFPPAWWTGPARLRPDPATRGRTRRGTLPEVVGPGAGDPWRRVSERMIALQRTNKDQLWTTDPPTGPLPRLRQRFARHAPPPRATTMSGWALMPLRLFIGGTFTFAGLQKLANPSFFDASNPTSIQAQLASAAHASPIHALIAHLQGAAVLLGVLISLGELAVGVATLVGLFSRVAAVGGMLLSFMLFLTVSYHSRAPITRDRTSRVPVRVDAPVAGGRRRRCCPLTPPSPIRARARAGSSAPAPIVPVMFDVVQAVCGVYRDGACGARDGAPCAPAPCPYLAGRDSSEAAKAKAEGGMDRRSFTMQGAAAAVVAGVAMAAAGLSAALGRAAGGTSAAPAATTTPTLSHSGTPTPTTSTSTPTTGVGSATTTPTTEAAPPGTPIGDASSVPVGGSASFTAPGTGDPALVVQPVAGHVRRLRRRVPPTKGCIVGFSSAAKRFICPCHGSQFNERTGARLAGPAPHGLTRLHVQKGPDGKLYVT